MEMFNNFEYITVVKYIFRCNGSLKKLLNSIIKAKLYVPRAPGRKGDKKELSRWRTNVMNTSYIEGTQRFFATLPPVVIGKLILSANFKTLLLAF